MKKIILLALGLLVLSCAKHINQSQNTTKESNSLQTVFKNQFYVGAALNERQIKGSDTKGNRILEKEFNTISPENCMKWMFLQPKPNVFDFKMADKYVALGEKINAHIIGHTLVWHSQLAAFMKEEQDSAQMASYIHNHIQTVVSRYKGKIGTWDVVNEALKENGDLRQSVFLNVLGEGYLSQAFKWAAQYDPNAKLMYNDYNICHPKKRAGVVRLVKQLQADGARIDGVGIQAHWDLKKPSIQQIEETILTYAALGVQVSFTELDISVLPNPWELVGAEVSQNFEKYIGDKTMDPYSKGLPDQVQDALAARYQELFKLFVKHQDKIDRVTFWGISDKNSWLNDFPIKQRTNYPLLFDRNYQPKKAYSSLLELQ